MAAQVVVDEAIRAEEARPEYASCFQKQDRE